MMLATLMLSNNGCDGQISVTKPARDAGRLGQIYRPVYPYPISICPAFKKSLCATISCLQLARSAALFGGTCFFFLCLNYLDQGQTSAIFLVAPLLITALAVLFLAEKIGIRRGVSVIGGFIGAL